MTAKFGKILRALIGVLLCACVIVPAVCAVAMGKADVNLVLNAGKTSAVARVVRFNTYSNGVMQGSFQNYVSEFGGTFGAYGTATFRNNIISLNRLREGDRVDFVLDFADKSRVKTKYRVVFECTNDYYELYDGLQISVQSNVITKTVYDCSYDNGMPKNVSTDWFELSSGSKHDYIVVSVTLPASSSGYSGRGTQISVSVQVVPSA